MESLRRGASGMDAARAVKGHGWPLRGDPRSSDGMREVERSETRMQGQAFLLTFLAIEKSESPSRAKPMLRAARAMGLGHQTQKASRARTRRPPALDPEELQLDSFRELRRLLDSVVAGLDKVTSLREQLSNRQQEIREFLARQAHADEKQWAMDFSRSVFNLMQRSPSSYAAVTQTVVAQATISRFAVVSLLS